MGKDKRQQKAELLPGTVEMLILKSLYYRLTGAGRKQLTQEVAYFERALEAILGVMQPV